MGSSTTALTEEQRQTVVDNLPLVGHIVTRLAGRFPANHSRDDLIQTGTVGLIEAATRFDPEVGVTFSTFASRRIEGAILDMLRQNDWAPRSVRALERRVEAAEQLLARQGREHEPNTRREISALIGLDLDGLDRLRSDVSRASIDSLDRPVGSAEHRSTVGESLADRNAPSVDEALDDQEVRGFLRDALVLLPERHRMVMVGFFLEGRSMTELGSFLGVTQSRASQIKEDAVRMIRDGIAAQYVDDRGWQPSDGSRGDTENTGEGRRSRSSSAKTSRQAAFNEAVASASSWRGRLTSVPLDAVSALASS